MNLIEHPHHLFFRFRIGQTYHENFLPDFLKKWEYYDPDWEFSYLVLYEQTSGKLVVLNHYGEALEVVKDVADARVDPILHPLRGDGAAREKKRQVFRNHNHEENESLAMEILILFLCLIGLIWIYLAYVTEQVKTQHKWHNVDDWPPHYHITCHHLLELWPRRQVTKDHNS